MTGDEARDQTDPPSRCPLAELPSQWASWRCQAPGYEGVAFSPAYVDQYCMTAHHAECRIFRRFGDRSELLTYKPRGPEPSEQQAEPTTREGAASMASQQLDLLRAIHEAAHPEQPASFTSDRTSETRTRTNTRKEGMMEVQQATLVSIETGDEIRVDMQVGRQKVVVTSAVDDVDGDLKLALERLAGKIEEVTFVRTPAGGEIRATVRFGGRSYESSWAIEQPEAEPLLGDLLDQLGRASLANVQSSLDDGSIPEADGPLAGNQGDGELAAQYGGDESESSWHTSGVAPSAGSGSWS
jgi:hypothetical protein